MNAVKIPISLIDPNDGQVEGLPKNPRFIRDEKFEALKKSLREDPEMLELREVLVYPYEGRYIAIGGNMRLAAMKDLGIADASCKVIPEGTSVEKLRAYTMKDNYGYGEWDQSILNEDWDLSELDDWGMDDIVMDDMPEEEVEQSVDIDSLFENYTPPEKDKTMEIKITFPIEEEANKENIISLLKTELENYNPISVK